MELFKFLTICAILYVNMNFVNSGFIFGEPCSSRNTLIISKDKVIYPHHITCVDITKSRLPLDPNNYGLVKNATTLYADNMNLIKFPRKLIQKMPMIQVLDVSNNKIKQIHPKALHHNSELQKFLFSNNRYSINKNQPILFSTLETLDLSKNRIKQLYPNTFKGLPNLRVLFLNGNKLKKMYIEAFKSLKNLKFLNLENNQIGMIPKNHKFISQAVILYDAIKITT